MWWTLAKIAGGAAAGFVAGARYRMVVVQNVVNAADAVEALKWQARADHLLDEVKRLRKWTGELP